MKPLSLILSALALGVGAVLWNATPPLANPTARVLPFVAATTSPNFIPRTYGEALAQVDFQLAAYIRLAAKKQQSWMQCEQVVGQAMRRARLTGQYGDYALAESWMARASAIPGAVPHLTQASLHFTLHRLGPAAKNLELAGRAFKSDDHERSRHIGLRADLALQSGQYGAALAGFLEAVRLHRSITSLSRLAVYYWRTADFDAADRLFVEAERLLPGKGGMERAWLELQRGLLDLDRGQLLEALAHYQQADLHLSGWWLVAEHIAEIKALTGDKVAAMADYGKLIAETGDPEFMDALVALHREAGDETSAAHLLAKANEAYIDRARRFPEATLGHSLEHALEFSSPREALDLARRNHDLRPGGETKVLLAEALLKAGKPEASLAMSKEVLNTPYRSARLYAAAFHAAEALGHPDLAIDFRTSALQLNSHALD